MRSRSRSLAPLAAFAALASLLSWLGPHPAVGAQPGAETWTVTEPPGGRDSGVTATVRLDTDGALSLAVRHGETSVLAPSPMGLTTTEADFTTGLTFLSERDVTVRERYATPSGKQRRHDATMRELTLALATEDGDRVDLVVRVADDGVAYRYVVPSEGGVSVTGEASAFRIAPDAPAWLFTHDPTQSNYETPGVETTVGEATGTDYSYPSLFRIGADSGRPGDDAWLMLTESDVLDQYGGTRLTLDDATDTFRVTLPDEAATSTGTMRTPWRVAIVGDLSQVVESNLVTDLATDSRVADTSWIEPGAVAWSWWSDSQSPTSPEIQRRFVDHAAEVGWPYVLVDEGWSADWVPDLVDYAAARGVRIILWTHWENLATKEQRRTSLTRWRDWGVAGVKIDFMNSDSQARMAWYQEVLADTAELRLMVNFHGSTLPRGIQRTWPHVMTLESVRGAEYYKWDDAGGPVHNVILPFTRNVVGSMDYTPVTFSTGARTTSDGHELGLSVVYESGWQHLADSPESYREHPVAQGFLTGLPTAWDETRLVAGQPGDLAVVARRHGGDWYLGGIAAGQARTVEAPLDFLDEGPHRAEIVHDGEGGGEEGLVSETRVVTRGDTLTVPVAENGGFVVRLTPAPERGD
ncbi:glycoside hydrolase family 97 catalytic domain-containing protein [Streptomyces sp. 4N509B]|uniref:glycoside hydrolase family 97 catalytic domain-containing protein n=1 Tax=Streptomyces sp. 4N509B TaxID=3457413 RepID=UPI003FD12CCA